jgi:ribosomal protein S18 acetylase RimI-like enzyme
MVHSLYVGPGAGGQGLGTRLLDQAVDGFRTAGLGEAQLWVFAANLAARRFYRRRGWAFDGGTRTEEEFGEPEMRLRRVLP